MRRGCTKPTLATRLANWVTRSCPLRLFTGHAFMRSVRSIGPSAQTRITRWVLA